MILDSEIECLSKAIHIIDFSVKDEFNVGRRDTNDVTVSDISVSRNHAIFTFSEEDDGHVFLSDNDSKFGTFTKLQKTFKLSEVGVKIPVQIEKKCFFFELRNRFSAMQRMWKCCGKST